MLSFRFPVKFQKHFGFLKRTLPEYQYFLDAMQRTVQNSLCGFFIMDDENKML